MKLLVAGWDHDGTQRLSADLQAAGHQVLGAVGRNSARTIARVVMPDAVLVPSGERADLVRSWLSEWSTALAWVELPPGTDAASAVAGVTPSEGDKTPAFTVASRRPPEPAVDPPPEPPPDLEPLGAEPSAVEANVELEPRDGGANNTQPFAGLAPNGASPPRLGVDEARDPTPSSASLHPELVSKLAQARFGDYHSILEIDHEATAFVVRDQHQRLSRRFSPQGWPGRLTADELTMLAEVARTIDDAFLILGDPTLRVRYEAALRTRR